jgi:hypothetical protein
MARTVLEEAPVDDVLHGGGSDRDPGGAGGGLVGVIWRDYKATIGYLALVFYVTVVLALVLDGQHDFQGQQERFNRNALEVRSANCLRDEREHLRDVEMLRDTYAYLKQLRPDELGDGINRFIIGRLSETEARAKQDVAPPHCDDPGFGLPEPDPVLPKRPAGF